MPIDPHRYAGSGSTNCPPFIGFPEVPPPRSLPPITEDRLRKIIREEVRVLLIEMRWAPTLKELANLNEEELGH